MIPIRLFWSALRLCAHRGEDIPVPSFCRIQFGGQLFLDFRFRSLMFFILVRVGGATMAPRALLFSR
jgi:hypothetical protein